MKWKPVQFGAWQPAAAERSLIPIAPVYVNRCMYVFPRIHYKDGMALPHDVRLSSFKRCTSQITNIASPPPSLHSSLATITEQWGWEKKGFQKPRFFIIDRYRGNDTCNGRNRFVFCKPFLPLIRDQSLDSAPCMHTYWARDHTCMKIPSRGDRRLTPTRPGQVCFVGYRYLSFVVLSNVDDEHCPTH